MEFKECKIEVGERMVLIHNDSYWKEHSKLVKTLVHLRSLAPESFHTGPGIYGNTSKSAFWHDNENEHSFVMQMLKNNMARLYDKIRGNEWDFKCHYGREVKKCA